MIDSYLSLIESEGKALSNLKEEFQKKRDDALKSISALKKGDGTLPPITNSNQIEELEKLELIISEMYTTGQEITEKERIQISRRNSLKGGRYHVPAP